MGNKQAETLTESESPLSVSPWIFLSLVHVDCSGFPGIQTSKVTQRTTVPILFGFFAGSPGVNGLCVVFSPKELALIVHLSLVTQEYETIIVHSNLNVFGA